MIKNKILSEYLGLEMTVPNHWSHNTGTWIDYSDISVREIAELIEKKQINRLVFYLVFKPEMDMKVRPTVHCTLTYKDECETKELLSYSIELMRQCYEHVEIVEENVGFPFVSQLCKSALLNVSIQSEDVELQMRQIVVPYEVFNLMFSFSAPKDDLEIYHDELMSIMQGLSIESTIENRRLV